MRTTLAVAAFAMSLAAYGQSFKEKSSAALSDTTAFHDLAWVDVDNDSLLDIVVFGRDGGDYGHVMLLKGNAGGSAVFKKEFSTGLRSLTYAITDIDGDNAVDLLVSGDTAGLPATKVFVNKSGFEFAPLTLFDAGASVLKLADLDQKGVREIIMSGTESGRPFLRILQQTAGGWVTRNDSIAIRARSLELFDFDHDNDVDFFVEGTDESGVTVNRVYYNQGAFYFTPRDFPPALSGSVASADVNGDGYFDLFRAGSDGTGDKFQLMTNTTTGFAVRDTLFSVPDPRLFAADLDSDGQCDVNLHDADTLNVVFSLDDTLRIAQSNLISQAFGDYDLDGDLDLAQLTRNETGYQVRVLENTTVPVNNYPGKPSQLVSANIFNRFFLYWDKVSDDRTAIPSLTYDLSIQSAGQSLMVPMFDLMTGHRLAPSHGNNGTANYVLIRVGQPEPVTFDIQAVDNSLFAGPGSVCHGSGGGGGGLCSTEIEFKNVEACGGETIRLAAEEGSHWFSFSSGFLADGAELVFDFQKPDTVFSVTSGATGCAVISVYVLSKGAHITKKTETTEYVCEGTRIHLEASPTSVEVEWSSALTGFLSSANTLDYTVNVADTISMRTTDKDECVLVNDHIFRISKPVVTVASEAYEILKGEQVQLSASGGVVYEWTPPAWLSDPQSDMPVASPLKTTQYSVLVKDSLGCAATAKVLVIVEDTGFIPNLFTPNYDGSNDVLKIYGLREASGFSFTIFNRQGNAVYHTRNLSDIVNNGWNGMSSGVEQPSGVYYWNVEGTTGAGKKLQLNGRISGSVVLLR